MADNFNPDDYETVEQRIKRFYETYPDGRISTKDYTTAADRETGTWRVKATIYLDESAQRDNLPKATGLAFEVDGKGLTQRANALETCETSAIGRALANMNMSGNKRPSREEMEKERRQGDTASARGEAKARNTATREQAKNAERDEKWIVKAMNAAKAATTIEEGRAHWLRLRDRGATQEELDMVAQSIGALPQAGTGKVNPNDLPELA